MRDDGSWFNYSGGHPGRAMRHGSIRWYWHRYGQTGLFRSVDLNLVGWAAVVGPGVVVGLIASLMTSSPSWATIPAGVLCAWAVALALDAIAWRRVTTGIGASDLTPSQVEAVLERLHEQAVEVSLQEDVDMETGEVWVSFQSTNRFVKAIQRELGAERVRSADDA